MTISCPATILALTRFFLLGDSSVSCDVFRLTGVTFRLTGVAFRLTGVAFRLTGVASVLADDPLALSSSLSLSTTEVQLLCLVGVAEPAVAADRFLDGLALVGLLLLPMPSGFGMSEYSFDFSYSSCEKDTIYMEFYTFCGGKFIKAPR